MHSRRGIREGRFTVCKFKVLGFLQLFSSQTVYDPIATTTMQEIVQAIPLIVLLFGQLQGLTCTGCRKWRFHVGMWRRPEFPGRGNWAILQALDPEVAGSAEGMGRSI
jgi:hypothetical protein